MAPSAALFSLAEWPSGLGKGLQSPVHGFDSRLRLHGSRYRAARPDEAVPLRCSGRLAAGPEGVPRGENGFSHSCTAVRFDVDAALTP